MQDIKSYLTIIDPLYLSCFKGNSAILVQRIQDGEVGTDEEARQLFDFSERSYDKLKAKTKRILLGLIMMSNHGQSDFQKVYNFCHNGRAASMILMGRGLKEEAIKLARRVFDKARENDLVVIAYELSAEICQHYSTIEPNLRLRKKYERYNKEYLSILNAQALAQSYYNDIAYAVSQCTGYSNSIKKKLVEYTKNLEKYSEIKSSRSQLFIKSLFVIKYFALQKYQSIIKVCDQALDFFEISKIQKSYIANFLLYKGIAQTAIKDFSKAEDNLVRAQEFVVKSKISWQWIMLYRTILAFHASQYDKAYSLYKEGYNADAPEFLKERWRIIGAYIYLLSKSEKLYTGRTRFGIGKFLNETAGSSLDKQGLNINIIIVVLMLLLQQKRYGEFLDRMDGLQSYLYRHTRDKSTARARLFLKMISHIPKHDFHSRTIAFEMNANLHKLKLMPVYASHNWEIEMVPFEILWEMVVDLLDSRRKALAV